MGQIARQLGVTRNVVSGKCARLGLTGRKPGARSDLRATNPQRIQQSRPIPAPRPAPPRAPNRNTIGARPNAPQPTKSELYEMLRRAVENTR